MKAIAFIYIHLPAGKDMWGLRAKIQNEDGATEPPIGKKRTLGPQSKNTALKAFRTISFFEGLTREAACIEERRLIKQYDTTNPNYGYNSSSGGEGISGVKLTKEVRQKNCKRTQRGNPYGATQKEKYLKASRADLCLMKQNKKLREANIGKKLSEEHKTKLSEAKRVGVCIPRTL